MVSGTASSIQAVVQFNYSQIKKGEVMIKKIIILAIILYCAYFFYEKAMRPTLDPFFHKYKKNVDFFGTKDSDYDIKK